MVINGFNEMTIAARYSLETFADVYELSDMVVFDLLYPALNGYELTNEDIERFAVKNNIPRNAVYNYTSLILKQQIG